MKNDFRYKFSNGDYVCTMYEGNFVYGTIHTYFKGKFVVLLESGKKIQISESTFCVKENKFVYI